MPDSSSLQDTKTLAMLSEDDGHGTTLAVGHNHDHSHEHLSEAHQGDWHFEHLVTHPPEPITITQLYWKYWKSQNSDLTEEQADASFAKQLHIGPLHEPIPMVGLAPWETVFYYGISCILTITLVVTGSSQLRRNREDAMRNPTRWQMFTEMLLGFFEKFTIGVLGPENGRRYLPFIGTMFLFILISNLMGLVPGLRPPTGSIVVTGTLALLTFCVVQYTALTKLGIGKYLHHLAGEPKDGVGWALAPLFLVLEIISTLAKPVSLALRLFGNMLGKDILLGSFIFLGITLVGAISPFVATYIGAPLTIPFYFLGMLLSAIQALVFSILSCIYILLVLPHDHHDHDDDHGHGHDHGHHGVHEPMPAAH